MTTLNLVLSANLGDEDASGGIDDGGKRPDMGVVVDTTLLSPGSHGSGQEVSAGARFTSVTIAQAATINSADYSMVADATYASGGTVSFIVCCQAADNAAALVGSGSTDMDGATRAGTTADSTWNQNSVTVGTRYTVSITSAVQELVNRAGWASGNAAVVLVDTAAATTLGEWQDYRAFNHASGGSSGGPHLDIDYTVGGVTPPRPTIVRQAVNRASNW